MSAQIVSVSGSDQTETALTSGHFKVDIGRYIAAGCLRISQPDSNIALDAWQSCSSWKSVAPLPEAHLFSGQTFIDASLQKALLATSLLQPFVSLQTSQWIRLEFRVNDSVHGQVRVYILPDDVGRSVINRNVPALRKALLLLLNQIDISAATWNGQWFKDSLIRHVDTSLDFESSAGEEPSLFQLFNTLPSPKPDPDMVSDPYVRNAMYQILDSDIEGLKTEMYKYQRRSAALMLQRESKPAQLLDPRLRQLVDLRGMTWYCDIDSGSCFREPRTYEAARGGICAETMGLGKTLICLGLIMATRDATSQIPNEYLAGTFPVRKKTASMMNMAAAALGRLGVPWKRQLTALEAREGYRFDRCREALDSNTGFYMLPSPSPRRQSRNPKIVAPRKILLTSATIVVAPANLIQQWQHEIKKHTTGLKVLVMKTMSDVLPRAEALVDCDIILFSKQRFDKEAAYEVDDNDHSGSTSRQTFLNGGRPGRTAVMMKVYHSPLKDLHFKRLIVDEGHTFGNSSSSSRTEASAVVDFLQVSARWIVSGTPTKGLYGAEVGIGSSQTTSREDTPSSSSTPSAIADIPLKAVSALLDTPTSDSCSQASSKELSMYHKQERKDIEKLGNIATSYLKARPWANRPDDNDYASWSHLIMQPRHGSKSRGNLDCLRATLEGMIIRHQQSDVELEVTLPPLYQNLVLLEGSVQNKLSLNTFSMMITANAVLSERKDADYFFHPRQRRNLQQLVSNLRQASFFWSGFETEHITNTIENAKDFLRDRKVPISPEDEVLLNEAIMQGQCVLTNSISKVISEYHEMPMHVDNDLSDEIRKAWSLVHEPGNPTIMGATMVHAAQKFVETQLYKEDPTDELVGAGREAMSAAIAAVQPQSPRPRKRKFRDANGVKKAVDVAPTLAGGVTIGDESSSRKRPRTSLSTTKRASRSSDSDLLNIDSIDITNDQEEDEATIQKQLDAQLQPKSVLKKSSKPDISGTLDASSPLTTAKIISTASAKLSYLMDAITQHSSTEKILIFYEADNVAYYIAQALECLGIKHLIYAKTLSSARRSQYVVTFNQSEVFRVLLMDVTQAAFGLDMSSASRVYFVNPVFSPQVEAQAVKRAHRIGQTKPVYVETLVLRDSIEEVILERRKELSTEEHNSCKSILDDRTMYDWIRNARFLDVRGQDEDNGEVSGEDRKEPEQMAMLENPRLVFGRGVGNIADPDQDLILGDSPDGKAKQKSKIMIKLKVGPTIKFSGDSGEDEGNGVRLSAKAKGKRKVGFVDAGDDADSNYRDQGIGETRNGHTLTATSADDQVVKKIRFA
ncbi:hypothetical protein ONS95_003301 [Cadophora gregata]|uniref:uncharacterized protein n=1 Tax=Cadophora gregata TaxID=51156 RepID=UPI0026DDBA1D|nr:uncharacterized protein ONS95_003301 [Cadophora gregata]KAK0108497.1 hypothetical protein ONS95_003301 [Cadophora gregata]KAK0108909.1 hypothetical protein ONS96_002745 [Cadophora gregata f. sp. sojae]